ncbi:hypothetical protein BC629DRAFT_1541391 [Irpex lacteus]|nr:hypothetical protein BC629DRAFT_1541391 [Irpex lacteus]
MAEYSSYIADLDAMETPELPTEGSIEIRSEWGIDSNSRRSRFNLLALEKYMESNLSNHIRCTYCDCLGVVVACSTCTNHACTGKCVALSERGNKAFQCLACLGDKPIPYEDSIPRIRAGWRRDGRWQRCIAHAFFVNQDARSKNKPPFVASTLKAAEEAFKLDPTKDRLTTLISEMRDDRHAEDITTVKAKLMRSSIHNFFLEPTVMSNPTWNYLAVVQTRSNVSGDLEIGGLGDVVLPIDRLLSRFTHKSLWYELTITKGTKGLLLFPAPDADTIMVSATTAEALANLVKQRRFTFTLVFMELPQSVASSVASALFLLFDQVLSRFADTSEATVIKIARIFENVLAADTTSLLLVYHESGKVHTVELINPACGIWSSRGVLCKQPCSTELRITRRNAKHGLKLVCDKCGRRSHGFISPPCDTTLLCGSVYMRPYPRLVNVQDYVNDQMM